MHTISLGTLQQHATDQGGALCIVKMQDGKITGWIIATDMHDARRRAEAAWEHDLAAVLYRMEFTPSPGLHELSMPPGAPEYVMLVQ